MTATTSKSQRGEMPNEGFLPLKIMNHMRNSNTNQFRQQILQSEDKVSADIFIIEECLANISE